MCVYAAPITLLGLLRLVYVCVVCSLLFLIILNTLPDKHSGYVSVMVFGLL